MTFLINGIWRAGNFLESVTSGYGIPFSHIIIYFFLFFAFISVIVQLVFLGLFGNLLRQEDLVAKAFSGKENPLEKKETQAVQYERALNMVYYITNTLLLTTIAICCVYMVVNSKK